MNNIFRQASVLLLILLLVAVESFADSTKSGEEINWQVVSSGGDKGESSSYGLRGTVSQTAIGPGGASQHYINHGFWQKFIGVQIPCSGICGNANGDASVNVSDAVYLINYVFSGGGAPLPVLACGDANSDGSVNVSDAVYLINYVFSGGNSPGNCRPGDPDWVTGDCCSFSL